jgi:hypothetical protein
MVSTILFRRRITSKIIRKIGILVFIEIIFIISSFAILAYFESQGTFLGNSINIAGKNRFLTANVLLQTEKYRTGSSNILEMNRAIDELESNILVLKGGGKISDLELKPLPPQFLKYWGTINENWHEYKTYIIEK